MWHYLHDMENSASQIKGFLWEHWNGDPIRGTYEFQPLSHDPFRYSTVPYPPVRKNVAMGHPQCTDGFTSIDTMWCPSVIRWFISPSNYGYKYHKP